MQCKHQMCSGVTKQKQDLPWQRALRPLEVTGNHSGLGLAAQAPRAVPTPLPLGQGGVCVCAEQPWPGLGPQPLCPAQLCCPGAPWAQSHGKTSLTRSQSPLQQGDWTMPLSLFPVQLENAQSKAVTGAVPAESLLINRTAATSSRLQPGHLCPCQLQLPPRHSQLGSHL